MALREHITRFFAKPVQNPAIAALYGACVAQARMPEFYRNLAVPDTVDGRFDMIILHVYLVMRQLYGEMDAKQQLFDFMFADMDRSLREMGVGDMGIGKRIKPMISAFYGRAQAYQQALAADDETLKVALARNVYGKAHAPAEALPVLADYVRRTVAALDKQPIANLASGKVTFVKLIQD